MSHALVPGASAAEKDRDKNAQQSSLSACLRPPPRQLVKVRAGIPNAWWFQDAQFNEHFAGLRAQGVRVTIWDSDGRVVYDNINGTNDAELRANYFQTPLLQNNHGGRLEAQLPIVKRNLTVTRGSSTVVGSRFQFWVRYVCQEADLQIRAARLGLLVS